MCGSKDEKGVAGMPNGEGRSPGRTPLVHSQVRRIREEDLRIADVAGEGLSARDLRIPFTLHNVAASADVVLCSRSAALPSSPLGNTKATVGSA
ncbi:hypothetical protein Cni_G02943 [Canna indica]|uniref:Uncharacterized protein n=1 Tax=Canna indica TaxID=4628 RepID=A0AAQ3JSZ1_9LILI|nr:hypothetical protein Cni_G02943 [Canna indica]